MGEQIKIREKCIKILVLGATGMLGNTLLRNLATRPGVEVHATTRSSTGLDRWFSGDLLERIHPGVDADNIDSLLRVLGEVRPDIVINCIGVIKQLASAKDPLVTIPINTLFPHRLALACKAAGSRLIHISTDCVFSGSKGMYTENDPSDAEDLYGKSKYLGEVTAPHCVTLRTSIIGHELSTSYSLIDWFLSQEGKVKGFTRAIYTGFPTVEIARIIAEYVIPNETLSGIYQVSSEPISKYNLLKLVAERYGKRIEIEPFNGFSCDRSLDSTRFKAATGYVPPKWPDMIEEMYRDNDRNPEKGSR